MTIASATTSSVTLNTVPICPHCNTKFASHNNLRRHIIEVHKTRESGGNEGNEAKIDRTGECTRCNISFSTVAEWVQHKINDAKNRKMTQAGYDWNCEICLKPFTRRERLMQHMLSHLNDREMDSEVLCEYNAKKSSSSSLPSATSKNCQRSAHQDLSSDEESNHEYEENEYDNNDTEESQSENDNESKKNVGKMSNACCDMCNVKFSSSQELRAHVVAEHFLNGSSSSFSTPTSSKPTELEPNEKNLEIDEDVERELDDVEFEEAEINLDDEENSSASTSSSLSNSSEKSSSPPPLPQPAPATPLQPIGRIQFQLHRCRICNSAFVDQMKSVKCMVSHQDRVTSFKCNDCQLYFKDKAQLSSHENLCHS